MTSGYVSNFSENAINKGYPSIELKNLGKKRTE